MREITGGDFGSRALRNLCRWSRGTTMPVPYGNTNSSNITANVTVPAGAPFGSTTGIQVTSAGGSNQGICLTSLTNSQLLGKCYTMVADVYVFDTARSLGFALSGVIAGPGVTVAPGAWTRMSWTSPVLTTTGAAEVGRPGIRAPASPSNYIVTNMALYEGDVAHNFGDALVPGWQAIGTSESVGYPYTLESIAGLPRSRWVASDLALADNANIISWTDRIDGRVLAPPNTPPTYRVASTGGRGGVAFSNGVDRRLTATGYAVSQPMTIFTVTDPEVSGANRNIYQFGAELLYGPSEVMAYAGTGLSWAGATTNAATVLAARFQGTTSALFADGVSRAAGNAGTTGLISTFTLGGHPFLASTRGYGGTISEHIVYTRGLDAETIARVSAWLARQYALPIPTGY